MAYRFFDKKSSGSGVDASLANKSATKPNYQLVNEIHTQIIKNLRKGRFIRHLETIFGALI